MLTLKESSTESWEMKMLYYFIAIRKLQHHLPSTPFHIEAEIEREVILLQIKVSTYFGHMFYAYLFHLNSNYSFSSKT